MTCLSCLVLFYGERVGCCEAAFITRVLLCQGHSWVIKAKYISRKMHMTLCTLKSAADSRLLLGNKYCWVKRRVDQPFLFTQY